MKVNSRHFDILFAMPNWEMELSRTPISAAMAPTRKFVLFTRQANYARRRETDVGDPSRLAAITRDLVPAGRGSRQFSQSDKPGFEFRSSGVADDFVLAEWLRMRGMIPAGLHL
jgi:hypothetical protein